MIYVYSVILIIFNSAFLLMVPFALPGNWLIVIATSLFAWWQWEKSVITIYTLIAITVLALVGEVLEFVGHVVFSFLDYLTMITLYSILLYVSTSNTPQLLGGMKCR